MVGRRGGKQTRLFYLPVAPHVMKAAALISALSHPTRLRVLSLIADEEISVGILGERVGVKQSALSQHLAVLRKVNLVTTRRSHKQVYYSSANETACAVLVMLEGVFGFHVRLQRR